MTFTLSAHSLDHLFGVDPRLQSIAHEAILLTSVDFSVTEGLRSPARQAELFASGASRKPRSEHLNGRAVDLAPWIGGAIAYQLPPCAQVAFAMRRAAIAASVKLRWGAVWDRTLNELDPLDLLGEVHRYGLRFEESQAAVEKPRHPLIDGVHYELAEP